jgi:hypothetical protein
MREPDHATHPEASAGQEACEAERNTTDQKAGGSNPSERARSQASPIPGGAFLLTDLLTAAINQTPPRGRR